MRNLYNIENKRCTRCGCYMYNDSELEICEVCIDELLEAEKESE